MMKFDEVMVSDLDRAYQNGRADMKREVIRQLTDLRSGTLGVMKALLTEMIGKVDRIQ